MMFNGMRPGERTTRAANTETEFIIPLKQAAVASVVGGVAGLLLHKFVLGGYVDVATALPFTRGALAWLAPRQAAFLVVLGMLLPWWFLWKSFGTNIQDGSWAPPYSARNPDNGPAVSPLWAWLIGWRAPKIDPLPEPQEYQGRAPSVDAREVTAKLTVTKGKQVHPIEITLPFDDWTRLRRYVAKGYRSVSEADLVEFGGFSSGANGRARVINKAFKAYRGATEEGRKKKPCIVEPLADWILARGYSEDTPSLPRLESV